MYRSYRLNSAALEPRDPGTGIAGPLQGPSCVPAARLDLSRRQRTTAARRALAAAVRVHAYSAAAPLRPGPGTHTHARENGGVAVVTEPASTKLSGVGPAGGWWWLGGQHAASQRSQLPKRPVLGIGQARLALWTVQNVVVGGLVSSCIVHPPETRWRSLSPRWNCRRPCWLSVGWVERRRGEDKRLCQPTQISVATNQPVRRSLSPALGSAWHGRTGYARREPQMTRPTHALGASLGFPSVPTQQQLAHDGSRMALDRTGVAIWS